MNIADITDIAFAMSVLLCLCLGIANVVFDITGIIILSIIIIRKGLFTKKAVKCNANV